MSIKNTAKNCLAIITSTVMFVTALSFMPEKQDNANAASACVIDTSKSYQSITGFGGINHPEWTMDNGGDLTAAQRQKAFGNGEDELGFTVLRVFVNPDKNQWNKAVPTAKYASSQGVTVFASPWEPPSELAESGGSNGKLHLPKKNYAAYAQHLNDFGTYMKNNGVDLYSVSVQNEPDYASEWTYWSTDETTDFLANYADKITSTRVMSPESFQYAPENASWVPDGGKKFYKKILNNAKAFANCDLFGTHFYGTQREWMDFPELENCGKPIWMTEVYVPDSKIDADAWPDSLELAENMHNGLVVGNMSAYVVWYIRRSYGPIKEDGNISKRGYCMAQYSKFVRPGYVRTEVTEQPADGVLVSAYKGDGNKVVVVAVNNGSNGYAQEFSLKSGSIKNIDRYRTSGTENIAKTANLDNTGNSFFAQLPAKSVSTFVITLADGTDIPDDPGTTIEPNEYGWYFHDEFEGSVCDWQFRGSDDMGRIATSGRTYYKGSESLGVYDRKNAWNGILKPLNSRAFEPGKEYSFSANVTYFDGSDTEKFSLTLQYKDASGETKYANIASGTVGKEQWVQLANKNFTIPSGATDLELVIETSGTTNNFYVDEVIGAVGGTTILGAGEYKEPVVTTTTAATTTKVTTTTTTVKATTVKATAATTKATTTEIKGAEIDESKYFMIKNMNSGQFMEVADGKAEAGANVQQWGADTSNPSAHNVWRFKKLNKNWDLYYIYSGVGDGNTFVLNSAGSNDGANISIENISQINTPQNFLLIENNGGSYTILTRSSYSSNTGYKSCVEVVDASNKSGANVQQWQTNNHNCQKWELIPVDYKQPVTTTITITQITTTTTTTTKATTKATTATTKATTKTTTATTKATTKATTVTTSQATTNKPGDLNGDGKTSVSDLLIMQKYLIGTQKLTAEQCKLADMNGDRKLNVFDLIILKRKILYG